MMPIPFPTADERAYIKAYGIAAIYVAARPDGRAIVRCSRDLLLSAAAMYRRWASRHFHIVAAYWVEDLAEARRILALVGEDRGCLVSIERAQHRIIQSAVRLDIQITEHALVLDRASSAVFFVANKIQEFHDKGQLKWFNRAYRTWRLQARAYGVTLTYGQALTCLRRRMFCNILFGLNINHQDPMTIFPPLPPQRRY